MNTTIFARKALLPNGWQENVHVGIDRDGQIENVRTSAPNDRNRPGCIEAGILLPAPVNVHSHAFQRAMAGLAEKRGPSVRDNFWAWRTLMFRFLDRLTPDHVEAITALVQMEMLEAGYSANVEFHYLHHQRGGVAYDNPAEMSDRVIAATEQTGIGLTLLPVHYQYGGCDKRSLTAGQIRFGTDVDQYRDLHERSAKSLARLPSDCVIGAACHSLRAVGKDALLMLAKQFRHAPFHLHIAEQSAEVEEVQAVTGKRPVEWLLDNMVVERNWCLIHCTQMLPHESSLLARTGAVAGLCPVTESNLGDGIFDGPRWLAEGGRIAIGSDSNVRISLSEELRTLDYSQRLRDHSRGIFANEEKSSGRVLFDAVVAGGAQAAGRESGRIQSGMTADLLSLSDENVDLCWRNGDTLLDTFIYAGDDTFIDNVWSAGRHMVQEGRHIHREAIISRYREVAQQLADVK